ncbi:MAG TPA: ADP-forming succinate--CoA ligase subunit beta [Verrucomicrobiales bacterium]|jgi:succinyl-CoA synthetase beta subunit|nr:ADP-forming succinate--CoA ligase subunit beta [Verrucomicrobiales bacterium]
MNIHEYQAKELFVKFGVPTPAGEVASTAAEAKAAAEKLGGKGLVVKAQVHAGGRGKGTFKNGFKGGVHLADEAGTAGSIAEQMIGQVLVTHQTGEEGKLVSKVLIAKSVDIKKEYYLAILMDRATRRPVIVASAEGGVNIEEVAEHNPGAIITTGIHPALGLQSYQTRKIARQIGLGGDKLRAFEKLITALYRLFIECDCSMVEINPLVETTDGQILALDAKFNFDDNALFRHPDIVAMRDITEEDPREVEASKFNLNYIGLDGNIACMVNGAGLAMATMDIIKLHGGDPANFLDVGGGASEEQVKQAFRLLCSDPNVKAILVNIFGGIMKCDVIAQGIINAGREIQLSVPLVVRLEGTNVEKGRELLGASGLTLTTATDLTDAAKKVVAAAKAA